MTVEELKGLLDQCDNGASVKVKTTWSALMDITTIMSVHDVQSGTNEVLLTTNTPTYEGRSFNAEP